MATHNVTAEVRDGKLVIICGVGEKDLAAAIVSKSAAEKAEAKGLKAPAPSIVATSGGFLMVGNVRVSLNVIK